MKYRKLRHFLETLSAIIFVIAFIFVCFGTVFEPVAGENGVIYVESLSFTIFKVLFGGAVMFGSAFAYGLFSDGKELKSEEPQRASRAGK